MMKKLRNLYSAKNSSTKLFIPLSLFWVLFLTRPLVYDPCIGSWPTANALSVYPWIQQNNNIMGFNQSYVSKLADMDQKCGYSQYRKNFMHFPPNGTQPSTYLNTTADPGCDLWDSVYDTAYSVNPC